MSSSTPTDCVQQPPGGSWESLKPTFSKSFRALFRKLWLNKIRDVGTLVSEIIATVLIVILYALWTFAVTIKPSNPKPKIYTFDQQFGGLLMNFNKFVAMGHGGNYIAMHNDSVTHEMVANYFGAQLVPILNTNALPKIEVLEWVNISDRFKYYDKKSDVDYDLTHHNSYGVAFDFMNSADPVGNWKNMSVMYIENEPLLSMFSNLAQMFSYRAFPYNGMHFTTVYSQLMEKMPGIEKMIPQLSQYPIKPAQFAPPVIKSQVFARPKLFNEMPINMAVTFFAAIPMVIACMPDLMTILSDKESHILTFTFVMGAPEAAYWLVSFVSTFLMTLIPYIVLDILFSAAIVMKGTDFLVLFLLSICFSLAFIMFQAFLSTFFTKAGTGRVLTVVFLILIIFFGYLNEVYTLKSNKAVKCVLSLYPVEAYQLVMSVLYEEVRNRRPAIGWKDVGSDRFDYPIYYAFIFLLIDFVLYSLLFVLFNACNDRGFGAPPLRWRDLFRLRLSKSDKIKLDDIAEDNVLINVDGLTKRYSRKSMNAVDDVSFSVKKGEIIVMIGPNGAGKSSIINTVSGAISADKGTLSLAGSDPMNSFTAIQKCMGIVFQENVLMPRLSIREHLEIFGEIRGVPRETLQDAIDFFADTLQLREMLPNRAGDLSGGQKRKLCIAMSLLGNPPIIFMDEPTAGVDVQARQLIWKTISNLPESTCIITTHALEEAEAVSSRMFVVARGKIPFTGTSTELRNEFKCGYVLKVDCPYESMDKLLNEIQRIIPDAKMLPERDDTISLPVSNEIPKLLTMIDTNKEKLEIAEYSFQVEQLEDVLLRIIETS